MKLAISNIAWDLKYDENIYKYMQDIGFEGLEVAPTKLLGENPFDKITHAKSIQEHLLKMYQIKIISLQSIWFGREENLFPSEIERKTLLEYTKKCILFAESIGVSNIVFGSPKNRRITVKSDYEKAIYFFAELGEFAYEHNTIIAIEANPPIYGGNFIMDTKESIDIVKDVGVRGIKINFDLGTFIQNDENFNFLDKNIDLVNHVHISEPFLEIIKKRKIHEMLKDVLQKNSYEHFISIEMKKQEVQSIREVMEYVKAIFNG